MTPRSDNYGCGFSYDHEWEEGDPECRACGADLSSWNRSEEEVADEDE